jgi:hypothetical protein
MVARVRPMGRAAALSEDADQLTVGPLTWMPRTGFDLRGIRGASGTELGD